MDLETFDVLDDIVGDISRRADVIDAIRERSLRWLGTEREKVGTSRAQRR